MKPFRRISATLLSLIFLTIPASVGTAEMPSFLPEGEDPEYVFYGPGDPEWGVEFGFGDAPAAQEGEAAANNDGANDEEFVINVDGTLVKYNGPGGDVAIPEGVKRIGDSAFESCYNLTGITIPSSVTGIEPGAFNNCTGLGSVTIPSSVKSIGFGAFVGCTRLSSVTIHSGVTRIEWATFWGCDSLNSVAIPSSVTYIGEEAFDSCVSLTSVTIPSSVTGIGDGAFRGCTSLTSITISSSVTSIGIGAFENCPYLTLYVEEGSYAELYANERGIASSFNVESDA